MDESCTNIILVWHYLGFMNTLNISTGMILLWIFSGVMVVECEYYNLDCFYYRLERLIQWRGKKLLTR